MVSARGKTHFWQCDCDEIFFLPLSDLIVIEYK